MDSRLEINESIVHSRLDKAWTSRSDIISCSTLSACGIGKILEMRIFVVIHTIAAAEDVIDTSLDILHVGRGHLHVGNLFRNRIINHALCGSVHTAYETSLAKDLTSQVVAAIDIVTYVWEAQVGITIRVKPHISLCMTEDISITRATK